MAILKDKPLEKLSNVAVILVAVVVIFTLLRHDLAPSRSPDRGFTASSITLRSITNTPSKLNLVLGISTVCPFCERNVDFYKTLSNLTAPGKLALYTIFPQSAQDAQVYLNQKHITPTGVISSPLSNYQITGTPTLLLLDSSGRVEHSWVGALSSSRQAEVLKAIHNE